ncbi:12735_t:CDS:2, partial [Dentiscutata heterogama]
LGSKEDLNFTVELSSKIDNILEEVLDLCDNETSYKVKYEELYIFFMKENSDSDRSDKSNIYYKSDRYDKGDRYDEGNRYDEGDGYNEGDRYNKDNGIDIKIIMNKLLL